MIAAQLNLSPAMSDSSSSAPEPDNKPPEDLPPPPPPPKPVTLPNPDGFGDINRASKQAKEKAKAEKKNKKKRRHPKDAYAKIKNKKGGGCLMAFLFLVVVPVGAAFLWINAIKTDLTVKQEYQWMTIKEPSVTEAPAEKTAYLHLGLNALYEVPETKTEVAFVGGNWWLSGTFHEKVTFRGVQLTLEPGSRFLKGLDVQAAKLDIGDAEIEGDLTGQILHQTAGD